VEETELARRVGEIMKAWIDRWVELTPEQQAIFLETAEFHELALIPKEFGLDAIDEFQRRKDILRRAKRLQRERKNWDSKNQRRMEILERERLKGEAERKRQYDQKWAGRASSVRAAEDEKASRRKYKFCCRTCNRSFFADEKPWPRCRKCQNDSAIVCVCSGNGCQKEFPGRGVLAYCDRCEDKRHGIRDSFYGGISNIWKTGKHSRGT